MTNKEKYEKELDEIERVFALVNGEPVSCLGTKCIDCDWDGCDCDLEASRWLNQEVEKNDKS